MKSRLLIIGIVLLFIGIIIFLIGVNAFFHLQATEERLASEIKAGSSIPIVNYDNAWCILKQVLSSLQLQDFYLFGEKENEK